MLPTFICIGPGRSATTFLFELFKKQRGICLPAIKEVNYFNQNYDKSLGWYLNHFRHCTGPHVGEISNTYLYCEAAATRVAAALPGARILSVLRNPFERMVSAYRFRARVGEIPPFMSFEVACQQHRSLITDNYYGTLLQRWYREFPAEQIHIAFFEDLRADAKAFALDILNFIGLEVESGGLTMPGVVNEGGDLRIPLLAPLIRGVAEQLRKHQCYSLLTALKRSRMVPRLLFRRRPSSDWSRFARTLSVEIVDRIRYEIAIVEELTGRDLHAWTAWAAEPADG